MLPALESLASVAYRLVRVSERAPIELGVPVEMVRFKLHQLDTSTQRELTLVHKMRDLEDLPRRSSLRMGQRTTLRLQSNVLPRLNSRGLEPTWMNSALEFPILSSSPHQLLKTTRSQSHPISSQFYYTT
ncbi:hypothetical protein PGT21_017464 [Puccinia graminis f. sp. tritici]|uniref:Uncharacterized protein n=1 Tax=Puccinia graminis f. sp. tritici TaxID=56615 RepID=A0A5B0LQW9_PUCGR|nr:hypothetical protein PGT21_017464 [Puccinia graminis f. sp. tritici]